MCSHPDSYANPSSYLESGGLELTFIDPEESHPDAERTRIENPEESQPDVENQYSTDHEESSLRSHSNRDVVFLRGDRGEQFQKRRAEADRQPGVQLHPTEKARLSHRLAVFHLPQSQPMQGHS